MRLSHVPGSVSIAFDQENLVACGGLVSVMALAERAGLSELVFEHVRLAGAGGGNEAAKVASLVGGMLAGAKTIDGMRLLRHGAMDTLFDQVKAPSTLGTFLRAMTFGHANQLAAVSTRLLAGLTREAAVVPREAVAAGEVFYLDIDDTMKQTYGYAKQGVGYGYNGTKGLNALIATLSSPMSAPVICQALLRRGGTASVRNAGRFVTRAINAARAAGATGQLVVRADSAFYAESVVAACRRAGAGFSVTMRDSVGVRGTIAAIPEQAWTPIKYPRAIWDEDEQRWISEAEVAMAAYVAFVGSGKKKQVRGWLIVRRVKRLEPAKKASGQGVLFDSWRHHSIFTDSRAPMLEAEAAHRDHAIIEPVHADLRNSMLSHLPSGVFAANAAWLQLAVMAYNISRAAARLAGGRHARSTTATVREQLILVPARVTRSARRQCLRMPRDWPRAHGLHRLHAHAVAPPGRAAA